MAIYVYTDEFIREPWENTVAYYPLTSTSTVNEQSWKSKTLTNSGVTFGTYQWVDCAYFDGSHYLYNNTSYGISWPFTVMAWLWYINKGNSYASDPRYYSCNNLNVWVYVNTNNTVGYSGGNTSYSLPNNSWWVLLTVTYDGTICKLYANWNNENTTSVWAISYSDAGLFIGRHTTSSNDYWKGGISEFITEKWAWSVQKISDYYNRTKSNYGIQ